MAHRISSLIAFACVAVAACKDPNAGVPRARTTAAPATTPAAPSVASPTGSEHLTFGPPASSVGFTGAKVTGSHNGTFGAFTGTIDFDPANIEGGRIEVNIETSSVSTDAERLTNHLKSPDFFDVARFPRATFTSTGIRRGANGAGAATHTVSGNLTLHGQTRAISFPANIGVTPGEITARAEFVINRRDFGLVYPGMPDNLIRDEVSIRFDVHAPRTPGAAPH